MSLEQNISRYIKNKGIALTVLARQTGISYSSLYNSLMNKEINRQIRGKELISICNFLEVDPRIFAEEKSVV